MITGSLTKLYVERAPPTGEPIVACLSDASQRADESHADRRTRSRCAGAAATPSRVPEAGDERAGPRVRAIPSA